MEILNNKNIKHVIKLIDHFVDSESNRDVLVLPRLKPIPKTGLNLIDIQKIAIQLFNVSSIYNNNYNYLLLVIYKIKIFINIFINIFIILLFP